MHPSLPRSVFMFPWATAPALSLLMFGALLGPLSTAQAASCEAQSGALLTPVLELYTSEGCSSCPPADQWLSSLKDKPVVAQAFHVAYWDYLGWHDRFASQVYTARQKQMALANGLQGIYTPQVLRNGRDWRDWGSSDAALMPAAKARANIALRQQSDHYEASVQPLNAGQDWSGYWTVTEFGHSSRVRAGENAGAFLQHDFVVRQYQTLGPFHGPQTLKLVADAAPDGHARQINLVVTDRAGTEPLQALSLRCQ